MFLEFVDFVPVLVVHAGNFVGNILAPRHEQKAATETHILHHESKKQDTKLVFIYSTNIDRFLKLFHCYTQQEICNEKVITSLTTPKRCRYTALRNISFKKLHPPKAQQRQTRRSHTEENVTAVGELVLSQ